MRLRMHHAAFALFACIWIVNPAIAYFTSKAPQAPAEPTITTCSSTYGVCITETQSSFVEALEKHAPAMREAQAKHDKEQAEFAAHAHSIIKQESDKLQKEIRDRAKARAVAEDSPEAILNPAVPLIAEPTEQSTCPGYTGSDANEVVESPENPDHLTKAQLYAERC